MPTFSPCFVNTSSSSRDCLCQLTFTSSNGSSYRGESDQTDTESESNQVLQLKHLEK